MSALIFAALASTLLLLTFFFFNDTATTEIYTLSLHDALPILLAEELGIEPGTALQRLEGAILLQDPSVEPEPPPPPPEVAALPPLPVPLTTFVGREQEVRDVDAAIERARLVTLLGPGGTGKTRLAVEVATRRS